MIEVLKFPPFSFLFFLIRKSQLFLYNNLSFLILTLWTVLKKKKKFSTHTIQKGNKQASGEEAATAAKSKVKNGKKIVKCKKKREITYQTKKTLFLKRKIS